MNHKEALSKLRDVLRRKHLSGVQLLGALNVA